MSQKNKKTHSGLLYKIIALLFILGFIIGIVGVIIINITPMQRILLFLFIVLISFLLLSIKKGWLKKLTSKNKKLVPPTNNPQNLQAQLSSIKPIPQIDVYKSQINDVLLNIDKMSTHGLDFEEFTVQLLSDNGFENVSKTQGSGDYGIDVLASKDGITYAIQCKCYSDKVGNKAVQEAFSGKSFYNCMVAAVLTNNYFTNAAIETAKANNVLLWDREKLIEFLKPYIKNERGRQVKHLLAFMATSVKHTLKAHNIECKIIDIILSPDYTLIVFEVGKEKDISNISNYLEEIANYIPSSCVQIKEANYPQLTLNIANPTELKMLL